MTNNFCSFSIALRNYLQKLETSEVRPISLPIVSLNHGLKGLREGEVTLLAGLEGQGKSALAQQILLHAVKEFRQDTGEKKRAGILFSMEMTEELILQRILVQEEVIKSDKLLQPNLLTKEDWEKLKELVEEIWDWPLIIDDSALTTCSIMRQSLEQISEEYIPKLIVVDYFQLLADDMGLMETNRLDNIAKNLKNLARQFNLHVIAISSLNRNFQDFASGPSSLNVRGSQGIAFAVDNVGMLYRPSLMDRNLKEVWKDFALLKFSKVRNGPAGEFYLKWNPSNLSFYDATREEINSLEIGTNALLQRKIIRA